MAEVHARWLVSELPALVRDGVIDAAAAERLEARYAPRENAVGRSRIVLAIIGVLGAVLIGAGLILVLAHGWDDLPRTVRAALAVASLLAGQAVAAFTLLKRRGVLAWHEAAGAAVVLGIAASIALVSRTYHVPGDLEDYLLACLVLAIPAVYLLDSRLAAALCWAAIPFRAFAAADDWWTPSTVWIDVTLLAALLPYLAWQARRPAREWRLLGAVALLATLLTGAAFHRPMGTLHVTWFAGVLAAAHAFGSLRGADGAPQRWGVLVRNLAAFGLLVLGIVCSFHDFWERLGVNALDREVSTTPYGYGAAIFAGLLGLVALWLSLARRAPVEDLLADGALVVVFGAWLLGSAQAPVLSFALCNLWLAARGLALTIRGAREGRLALLNHGLIVVAALVVARFFDTDLTFLERGIGFIVVGAAILALNLRVARRAEVAR